MAAGGFSADEKESEREISDGDLTATVPTMRNGSPAATRGRARVWSRIWTTS